MKPQTLSYNEEGSGKIFTSHDLYNFYITRLTAVSKVVCLSKTVEGFYFRFFPQERELRRATCYGAWLAPLADSWGSTSPIPAKPPNFNSTSHAAQLNRLAYALLSSVATMTCRRAKSATRASNKKEGSPKYHAFSLRFDSSRPVLYSSYLVVKLNFQTEIAS